MVIPAIRVVIIDDHRRAVPGGQALEVVDGRYYVALLIQRIRVAGVAVLIVRRLEEGDGRHVPRIGGRPEVIHVVLVVRLVGLADGSGAAGSQMMRIGGLVKVLERLVMRIVVPGRVRIGRRVDTDRLVVRDIDVFGCAVIESTLKPAPGDCFSVQEITGGLAGLRDSSALVGRSTFGAVVVIRVRVAVRRTGCIGSLMLELYPDSLHQIASSHHDFRHGSFSAILHCRTGLVSPYAERVKATAQGIHSSRTGEHQSEERLSGYGD